VAKYRAVKSVYLFGSILRSGAFRPDSDIHIAIEGGSAEDYFALWRDLEEALPDWLIDIRDLPPDTRFTEQVRQRGEKIYDCPTLC
jgi:predicted nucleotidyltransferase